MTRGPVHICQFDTTGHLRGRKRTYEAIRAAVLEAGRFSVFEATQSPRDARLFMRLERDPTIETVREGYGYPWIGVRRRGTKE